MNQRYGPILVSLSLLTACNLVPDFKAPSADLSETWRYGEGGVYGQVDPTWWKTFGSDTLDGLIDEALAFNNDLAAASWRIEQARAQAKIAGADLWPAIGIAGSYSSVHNHQGESQKKSADLAVSYEVDLWGANRAKRDAGRSLWLSEVFTRDAFKLVMMADVGQTYFTWLSINERIGIATEFLQNVTEVLAIVEARFQTGAVSAIDLAQQRTELAAAKANLDLLKQQQALTENALAILLGRPPQRSISSSERFVSVAMPEIEMLQPGSLLQRRPDLRQIELQLKAANAEIGIALAAFYPKLQLNLDALLAAPQPAGLALTMLAGLAQPLFQGGRLEGGLEYARARNAELIETYQQTLLVALKEVEDAAAIKANSSRRLQALTEVQASAEAAYRLSLDRYRVGAIDFQTLLNTQRTLLTAQNNRVQARLDVLIAMVQLYKALGGGWAAKV